jgi:hypothetical protein
MDEQKQESEKVQISREATIREQLQAQHKTRRIVNEHLATLAIILIVCTTLLMMSMVLAKASNLNTYIQYNCNRE